MKKIIKPILVVILLVTFVVVFKRFATFEMEDVSDDSTYVEETQEEQTPKRDGKIKIIAIDPGHGGSDPGKVGDTGACEKDINLAIGKILKQKLEEEGFLVCMTRDKDVDLYTGNAKNKKLEILKERCRIIEESNADIAVCIHQNSFERSIVKGAQVFYYKESEDGRQLAVTIQKSLKDILDNSNDRAAKDNSTYYMLKKSQRPTVIVECGFLSNPEEEKKLNSTEYQEKVALAIVEGIKNYDDQISADYKESGEGQ